MNDKLINKFWNWFQTNIDNLLPKVIDSNYVDLLSAKIEELGDLSWEIGYDNRVNKYFLALSPEYDEDLFELSKKIVNEAPFIDNWIFYSAKPPKQWKLIFDLLINGEKVRFNASDWKYVLYRFDDGVYDIVIKVPNSYKPYEEHFNQIGIIATTGELGEAFVIEYINKIDLVYELDDNLAGSDFITLKTKITS